MGGGGQWGTQLMVVLTQLASEGFRVCCASTGHWAANSSHSFIYVLETLLDWRVIVSRR